MRFLKTILVAGVMAGPARAGALDLQPYVGKPYATLHARLVSAGYGPFRTLQKRSQDYRMNIYGRGDVYDRYEDVHACAGTGLGDCEFVLRHGADVIVVHTTGEAVESLVVADLHYATAAHADSLYKRDPRLAACAVLPLNTICGRARRLWQ